MSDARTTTDHDEIRRWAEARGGHPAAVKATHKGGDAGILRIDFDDGEPDPGLERISWEDFFRKFDETAIAFLHQDKTADGKTSRFFKFVRREEG
ncbi:hypothetical protein [Tistrella mobilis]|uniref:1,4-alpha-glucan branching enzyme n=1 Tax=Tistrella mobilis (strain KA081020-065) TaxID=1110502 RepID=I3TSH8_TISMK|nr:hypothetical protein [Tistrella mobilis]AFK55716.1 hypothetical protein TMO_a0313 [Tistrella mobilis KA081020-065]MAM72707.1 hypothetical protein [Tistrella sp.]